MSIFNSDYTLNYSDMDILPSTIAGEQKTPVNVVESMVDSLDSWTSGAVFTNPNYRFLDIYSKSGIYLAVIYNRLMKGLAWFIDDPANRSKYILEKMLYGLSPTIDAALVSRKTLYGNFLNTGNIIQLHGLNSSKGAELNERVKGALNNMKFDVVIGNPPYNRGIDIDFVNLGYELSTKYCCMITPAKWQTAEADQKIASQMSYGEFRKKIVPHMSHIVFYPDCFDLFDIQQKEGIAYFLLNKNNNTEVCNVKNYSKLQPKIDSNSDRNILHGETLWNIGYNVITSIEPYKNYKFKKTLDGKYKVYTGRNFSHGGGHLSSGGGNIKGTGTGGYMFTTQGNLNCVSNSRIVGIEGFETQKYTTCTFSSDDIKECESFISWLNTKFTRFFVLIALGSRDVQFTDYGFRFVPAPTVLDTNGNRIPGNFDHIYTDEELYKTFNLPQEYIDVIESIIKERK